MFKEKPQEFLPHFSRIEDALDALRDTTKRGVKEEIIKGIGTQIALTPPFDKEFFEGVRWCYDQRITFGVKQVQESQYGYDGEDEELIKRGPQSNWKEFTDLLKNLAERKLSGNGALEAIEEIRLRTTPKKWNEWYRPILVKDLKLGCTETTVNKVLKILNRESEGTKVYQPALAQHISSLWKGFNDLGNLIPIDRLPNGEVIGEIKLNGVRLNAFIDPIKKTVILRSRQGRELENFPDIKESLKSLFQVLKTPVMLDGEVMSKTFSLIMQQINRKEDVKTKDCVFHVFDVVPIEEFENNIGLQSLNERVLVRTQICDYLKAQGVKNIRSLTSHRFNLNELKGCEELEKFRVAALDAGYEGLVMKNPEAVYECERSFNWLAYKPTLPVDLKVVGFQEGSQGTKNEGSLGALICEGWIDSEDEFTGSKFVKVHVGSGFTDKQRQEIWNNQASHLGQILEVKADEVTKAMNEDHWSLRFPRFVRWRGFTQGEKI